MHSAVLQNKKYIRFADRNTVDVLTLGGIEKGVEKGDPRAARYTETNPKGESVEYFVQFPGLTLEDFEGLNRSHAGTYNTTRKVPYTALVDPYTLERVEGWLGGQSANTIMEAATGLRRRLAREHDSSIGREDYRLLVKSDAEIDRLLAAGGLKEAFDLVERFSKKSGQWPESLRERLAGMRERTVEAARAELRRIGELASSDPAAARRDLRRLMPALRGTELQDEAEELLRSKG